MILYSQEIVEIVDNLYKGSLYKGKKGFYTFQQKFI